MLELMGYQRLALGRGGHFSEKPLDYSNLRPICTPQSIISVHIRWKLNLKLKFWFMS